MNSNTLDFNISFKLLLITLSAILIFGGIFAVVYVSFNKIETLITTIVKRDVPRIVDNSQVGNELTGMFADLLLGVFYGEEEVVKANLIHFEQTINVLNTKDADTELISSLSDFRQKLIALYNKSTQIGNISEQFIIMDNEFFYALETLQDILYERIEVLKSENGNELMLHYMEQLVSMVTRYREEFFNITMKVIEMREGKGDFTEPINNNHPVVSRLNYFHLELQTLSAAENDIKEQGKHLSDIVLEYKATVIHFLKTTAEFKMLLKEVRTSKVHAIAILKQENNKIASTTGGIHKRIDTMMQYTTVIIILMTASIVIVISLIMYSVINTFKTLKKINESLDQRVEERTAELKRINETLEIAKEAAYEAALAKSNFLANMSHEIRTPMNGVIIAAELALAQELTPKIKQYLKIISASGHSLLGIINDILDFSKIEAGKLDIENTPFRIDELLENISSMFIKEALEQKIELIVEIDHQMPLSLLGDPLRLRQIITNLVSNAIKFSEDGGVVSIGVTSLNTTDDHVELKFFVKDTGIGIKPEYLENLFEPFTQADSSVTRKYGGTGLGLTICKQLVEVMGGEIWAESEFGTGTVFYFLLKLNRQQEDQEKTSIVPGDVLLYEKQLKGTRILLVEDNKTNQFLTIAILKKAEVHVDIANNGKEAVDMVNSTTYDAVLMDIQMPEMDGYEATKIIRQNPDHLSLPIIAMTAHAMKGDEKKCLEAGMDGYVTKPINQVELFGTLLKMVKLTR